MAGQEWMNDGGYEDDALKGKHEMDIDTLMAGGVTVLSIVHESELGVYPGLVFRFVSADNKFYPPMTLILDDQRMREVAKLFNNAAHGAVRGADIKRREQRRGNTP